MTAVSQESPSEQPADPGEPVPPVAGPYTADVLNQFRARADAAYGDVGLSSDYGVALFALIRAHRIAMERISRVLDEHDLTVPQSDVIQVLGLSPDHSMTIVALRRRTLIHSATMTRTLDVLEARGAIRRGPFEHDARVVVVELTESGRALAMAMTASANLIQDGLAPLTPDEARKLAELLAIVGARVEPWRN